MHAVLLLLFAIVPIVLLVGVLLAWRKFFGRDSRRSPLSGKRAHLPGEQLLKRVDDLGDDVSAHLAALMAAGPLLASAWLLARVKPEHLPAFSLTLGNAVYLLAFVVVFGLIARRLIQLSKALRRAREGRAAEIATAQMLVPLAAKGCQLFHDLPGDKFNIDHVVVAPHAVFMVETKSRRKPETKGKASANVDYDGQGLQFPGWRETKPLEQARHQTRWLADYLKGATGEPVPVIAVVALPGWFVNLGKDAFRSDVKVFNPKAHALLLDSRATPLPESLRNRVIFALTQRYPDFD